MTRGAVAVRSTWGVRDSREPDRAEGLYPTVTEAIREARKSGLRVWLHADDCPATNPLGPDCPCRPLDVSRDR